MDGATTPGWRPMKFAEMLSYEQPGPYLVITTQQLDVGRVPVLTAGKTFILGYTNDDQGVYTKHPVIIFDDFTTASKFVDFDFKAKSSAMKILSGRPGIANVRYLYERMQMISFPVGDHKRHWISEYSQTAICVPGIVEQNRLSELISDLTHQVSGLLRLITKKQAIQQGMMQQLLTGRDRLPGFNERWRHTRLGDVAGIKTGSRNNQDKKTSGKYPFFVRSATVERIDSYSYDCEAILIPGEGGIGSIFHYVDGKFEVHQRVYKISHFESGVSGRFVFFYLQHFFGRYAMENSVKATVDSLRLPTFQGFSMNIPGDVEEQRAIARTLDDATQAIESLRHRLTKAKAVKQGMMQQLLTGRTRIPLDGEGAA
jgi:restriction endonuclease S subunit